MVSHLKYFLFYNLAIVLGAYRYERIVLMTIINHDNAGLFFSDEPRQ